MRLNLGDLRLWFTRKNLAMLIDVCTKLMPTQQPTTIESDIEVSVQVSNIKAAISQLKTRSDALIVDMAVGSKDRPLKFLSADRNMSLFVPLESFCATIFKKSQEKVECLAMKGMCQGFKELLSNG